VTFRGRYLIDRMFLDCPRVFADRCHNLSPLSNKLLHVDLWFLLLSSFTCGICNAMVIVPPVPGRKSSGHASYISF
jgi:hypothetical protein